MESGERIVSLRVLLSSIIGVIIVLLTATVCVLGYISAYGGAEKSVYIEELENFTKSIDEQVDSFYQDNVNEAQFLARLEVVKSAIRGGKIDQATALVKGVFAEKKLYENAFISTAEEDSRIVAAALDVAVGQVEEPGLRSQYRQRPRGQSLGERTDQVAEHRAARRAHHRADHG